MPIPDITPYCANLSALKWRWITASKHLLSLDLEMQGETLRLYDPVTGRYLPTLIEEKSTSGPNKPKRVPSD